MLRKNADEVIPKKLHNIVFLSKVSCTEEFDMLGNASLALIHAPPPMINRVIMDCGHIVDRAVSFVSFDTWCCPLIRRGRNFQ